MRRRLWWALAATFALTNLVGVTAEGLFTASTQGIGGARAVEVAVPASPTVTGTSRVPLGLPLNCRIDLAWPAPPTGQEYTLIRYIGSTPTTVFGPTASAGTLTDTVALAVLTVLTGPPRYVVRSHLAAATQWTRVSAASPAGGCLL